MCLMQGITLPRRKSALPLRVDFFREIDSEDKAYVLGLFAADAYVDVKEKNVTLCLAQRDEEMVFRVRDLLCPSAVVREKRSMGYAGSTPQRVVWFCSKQLVRDTGNLLSLGTDKGFFQARRKQERSKRFAVGL